MLRVKSHAPAARAKPVITTATAIVIKIILKWMEIRLPITILLIPVFASIFYLSIIIIIIKPHLVQLKLIHITKLGKNMVFRNVNLWIKPVISSLGFQLLSQIFLQTRFFEELSAGFLTFEASQ
jgi:hypothetical protein